MPSDHETGFAGGGLVVSLPSTELAQLNPSGSFTSIQEVLAANVSSELSHAIRLLLECVGTSSIELKCLMRPELFVGDLPTTWLRQRLGTTNNHVCISDGTTLKGLPHLRNHLFLYSPSSTNWSGLSHLLHRAPELFLSIDSQINSAVSLELKGITIRPPTTHLLSTDPRKRVAPSLFRLQLNSDWIDGGVSKTFGNSAPPVEATSLTRRLCYIPLTRSALQDSAFAYALAAAIRDACFDSETLLVLRLTPSPNATEAAAEMTSLLLTSLRHSGVLLPQITRDNVLVSMGDMAEDIVSMFETVDVFVHNTFEYWIYTKSFYERCNRVLVFDHLRSLRMTANYQVSTLHCHPCAEPMADLFGSNAMRSPLDGLEAT